MSATIRKYVFQTYIRGIGGHTGVPKNKVNPFELAFQYVEKLKEWINTKKQNVEDIQPFINIGHFQGGTASGTIPSECELFWGTRVLPEDNFDDYVLEVNEITKKFQNCIPNDCCIETKLFEGGGIDSFSSRSIYADKLIELAEEKNLMFFLLHLMLDLYTTYQNKLCYIWTRKFTTGTYV